MAPSDAVPWQSQLSPEAPEALSAGRGILILSSILLLWLVSIILRFAPPESVAAGLVWLATLTGWFVLQIAVSRRHIPEKYLPYFSTLIQVAIPLVTTGLAAFLLPDFRNAVVGIATAISLAELSAIQILRLAAWGTIAKYQAQQLPKYFFLAGSVPDFLFAISAIVVTYVVLADAAALSKQSLILWSFSGIVVFFGAGATMYFGVKNSRLGFRWKNVKTGIEPPTLLPFRWPMNLAPAFCVPLFILAHQLMIVRLIGF